MDPLSLFLCIWKEAAVLPRGTKEGPPFLQGGLEAPPSLKEVRSPAGRVPLGAAWGYNLPTRRLCPEGG